MTRMPGVQAGPSDSPAAERAAAPAARARRASGPVGPNSAYGLLF